MLGVMKIFDLQWELGFVRESHYLAVCYDKLVGCI